MCEHYDVIVAMTALCHDFTGIRLSIFIHFILIQRCAKWRNLDSPCILNECFCCFLVNYCMLIFYNYANSNEVSYTVREYIAVQVSRYCLHSCCICNILLSLNLLFYTVIRKDTKLLPISSPNIIQFLKFFRWQTEW